MDQNKIWMSNAKNIGCTFAALFAKKPELVGWQTQINPERLVIPKDCFILSLQFPYMDRFDVMTWALKNGFYLENLPDGNTGLRYKIGNNVAWVQYFGQDSHVKTRRTPVPELMMCFKVSAWTYAKVGFKGVLHLAHASIAMLTPRKADKMWNTSHKQTERSLGFKPTLAEAAKTTYHEL